MTPESQPITTVGDQHAVAAEFHALLDEAVNRINDAAEGGLIDAGAVARLRASEAALRYQIRQLRAASAVAANDLESGMRLSWSRFESQLRNSISSPASDGGGRTTHPVSS